MHTRVCAHGLRLHPGFFPLVFFLVSKCQLQSALGLVIGLSSIFCACVSGWRAGAQPARQTLYHPVAQAHRYEHLRPMCRQRSFHMFFLTNGAMSCDAHHFKNMSCCIFLLLQGCSLELALQAFSHESSPYLSIQGAVVAGPACSSPCYLHPHFPTLFCNLLPVPCLPAKTVQ